MTTPFLKSCCRVCLAQEYIMLYVYDKVDDFEMTLSELLETCADLKIDSSDAYTKLICKECTEELLMVAKFREKCKTSKDTLYQLSETMKLSSENELEIEVENTETNNIYIDQPYKSEEMIIEYDTNQIVAENDGGLYIIDDIGQIREQEKNMRNSSVFPDAVEESVDEEDDAMFEEIIEVTLGTLQETENLNDVKVEDSAIEEKQQIKQYEVDSELLPLSVINHSCDFCGAGFMHLNNLKKHLLTHQEANQLFECDTCTMMFTSAIEYNSHMNSHRLSEQCSLEDVPESNPTNQLINIAAQQYLNSVTTKDNGQSNNRFNAKTHKNHKCPYCEHRFVTKSLLNTHIRTHTGERPFPCTQCDKTFKTRGGLDLHIRRHSGVKPHMCSFCDKRFVESSNLRVHMRIHTGEKPHRCNRCQRSFSRVFLLQIHQRTHTGERPYSCPECNKSFAQQGDLAAHKRIHTGERPHHCSVCGKGFIKSSALSGHIRRHQKDSENIWYKDLDDVTVTEEHPELTEHEQQEDVQIND